MRLYHIHSTSGRTVSNLILLVACFVLGMALRRAGKLPAHAPAAFNSFIIHISLPALTLLYVHDLRWNPSYALAAAMPWLHFGLAAGFFWRSPLSMN